MMMIIGQPPVTKPLPETVLKIDTGLPNWKPDAPFPFLEITRSRRYIESLLSSKDTMTF